MKKFTVLVHLNKGINARTKEEAEQIARECAIVFKDEIASVEVVGEEVLDASHPTVHDYD